MKVSQRARTGTGTIATYLSLRDEEPDENEHAQTEAGESNESAVAACSHSDQHVWHCAGDDKVEEPLGGGGESNVKTTEASSRDLRDVDPADRSPAPLEEGRKEVDADERDVASRRNGCILLRRSNAHEDTDVHHRQTHGDRSPEKRLATSKRIGGEDQEASAHDDTVDASGEEAGLGTIQAQVGKDLRRVVVDCICTLQREEFKSA
jgi:hypothetical protein